MEEESKSTIRPGTVLSHYQILERIGGGAFADVYAAQDLSLGRQVALKVPKAGAFDPAAAEQLKREARAASALNHPNIAQIFYYEETPGGRCFIVMELARGRTLRDILGEGPMDWRRALRVGIRIAEALECAHAQGIIHRDIKPGNVCISDTGTLKVLDFGLARAPRMNRPVDQTETSTSPGLVMGTLPYMPPEQVQGQETDETSDLWALGVLLYECLTGTRPFEGRTTAELAGEILHKDPAPPSRLNRAVSNRVDAIVLKLLRKKREQRFRNAGELLRELREAEQESSKTWLAVFVDEVKYGRGKWLAAAMALLAVAAGTSWYYRQKRGYTPKQAALQAYERGLRHVQEGSFESAVRALERAVAEDPDFALAHARLAEALLELGHVGQARQQMLKARPPGEGRPLIRSRADDFVDAVYYAAAADRDRSLAILTAWAESAPESGKAEAALDLCRAQSRAGRPTEALASCERALMAEPGNAAAHLRRGLLLLGQREPGAAGALAQARKLFRENSNPEGEAEALLAEGIRLNLTRKPGEAQAVLAEALKISEAVKNEQQALRVRMQISEALRLQGRFAEAEAMASEVLERAQGAGSEVILVRALINHANMLGAQGQVARAADEYRRAIREADRVGVINYASRARVTLSSIVSSSDPKEALALAEKAVEQAVQDARIETEAYAYVSRGRARRALGDIEGARADFVKAAAIAGKANMTLQLGYAEEGLATLLEMEERYPQVIERMDKVVALMSDQPSVAGYALVRKARAEMRLGRLAAARTSLERAKQMARGNEIRLISMALAEESAIEAIAGRTAAAVKKLDEAEAAAKGQVNYAELRRRLAVASLAGNGQAAKALRLCEEAAGQRGAGVDLLLDCAAAALKSGAREKLQVWAREAQAEAEKQGKIESEWRAWGLLVRADPAETGARQRAARSLEKLEKEWGREPLQSFLTRPDVVSSMKGEWH